MPSISQDQLDAMHHMFGDAALADLLALYQDDAPKRIDIMRTAARLRDPAQLASVAHAFGGSCASIGASALCAMCKEIETQAKGCTLDGIEQHLSAIETEYHQLSAQLRSTVASLRRV